MLKWKGLTNQQAAKELGISKQTFYIYIDKYPDFRDAVKRGNESIVEQLENALFKRAIGYKEENDEIIESKMKYDFTGEVDKSGKPIKILVSQEDHMRKIKKNVIPDITAGIFLLTNKRNSDYKRNPDLFQDNQSIQPIGFKFKSVDEFSIIPEIKLLPHQLKFVETLHPFPALVGGYGSGKSAGATFRTMDRIDRRKGKCRMVIGAPTYQLLRDVNMPKMVSFMDQYRIPFRQNKTEHKLYLTGKLKGEIWFKSMDDPTAWIGFECTDAILDEFDTLKPEKQKLIWIALMQRLRMQAPGGNPTGAIVTTPEGYRYTYELVQNGTCKHIRARTDDNIYLDDFYLDNFFKQFDDIRLRQARLGEFVNLNGRAAYYAFKKDQHVTNDDILSKFPSVIHGGMDFNVDPMTSVWGYDENNVINYGKEYYINNSNTYQMADIINRDFPEKRKTVHPDSTFKGRHTSAAVGVTNLTILQDKGFDIVSRGNPSERDRINVVNWALANNRIRIDARLQYLLRDLHQVVVNQAGVIDKKDMKLTHISDAMGYDIFWTFFDEYFNYKVYQG